MASAPGNKDCEIVFVALVSSGGFAQKVSITVFSVFMNSEQKYTTEAQRTLRLHREIPDLGLFVQGQLRINGYVHSRDDV